MNLKEAIIKKIDELFLKGVEVYAIPHACGFEIGEIKAFRSTTPETTVLVVVLGASMSLDAQDAVAIYDYLVWCYYERLDKEANRKREAALEYLGVS